MRAEFQLKNLNTSSAQQLDAYGNFERKTLLSPTTISTNLLNLGMFFMPKAIS